MAAANRLALFFLWVGLGMSKMGKVMNQEDRAGRLEAERGGFRVCWRTQPASESALRGHNLYRFVSLLSSTLPFLTNTVYCRMSAFA